MTRSAWIGVLTVVVVVGAVGAFFFRGQLRVMLGNATPVPVVATSTDPIATWQSYSTTTYSLKYPAGYTQNAEYAYDQFGQAKLIHGVSFTVPAAMATGTNLSSDTRISVEQLPRAKVCSGDIYIKDDVRATKQTIHGIEYSVASTSGAGAGNFYEEVVYAISSSTPCTAVRYLIHSTNINNYPVGAVREFDRAALLMEFDQVRDSLQVLR